jgi:thiamine-monophosphate kinase
VTRTLRDLGEFEVIRRLLAVTPAPSLRGPTAAGSESAADAIVVGAGDDAAILRLRGGHELVATTDTLLEAAHFRRDWIDAATLGARLAETNSSDLAAMAAEPRWALVSFGVRADHPVDDLLEIQNGLVGALAHHGAVVAGGNLTAVTGEEWMTMTLLGEIQAGRAWTRSGARPGDLLAVTGHPGRAGVGCALALELGAAAHEARWADLIEAWRAPRARVGLALALARTGAVTAAIDLSDGMSSDLEHLCEASGVGARLEAAAWPADTALESAAAALSRPADALRLGASDDYELILAIDPPGRAACERVAAQLGVPLAFLGAFTDAPDRLEWIGRDGSLRTIEPSGYDHFAGGAASG